jgi:hypothetical protein
VHRRNWVEDSSALRVWTCQTYAVLFPHFGHSIRTVGSVRSFCSFLPMTATNCCGLCWIVLPILGATFWADSCFLYPHFGHTSIKEDSLPFSGFLNSRREPHFGQNSICVTPLSVCDSLYVVSFKLFLILRLCIADSRRNKMRHTQRFWNIAQC